ncbi:MAG: 3-hydroxyacyl-CoA dehydrogenase NAD-binding domain-containing protein, partial [Geobacteraceae bacterium]|nr:3-hydroxyacyl-CoA dehydrogenase NAD-binding domain-containing protein [Geobacteraceae bacterium]
MNLDDIKTVGMAGAGSMGAGIAQVAAQAGFQVKVVDVSEEVWGRARKTIIKSLERIVKKGNLTEAEMEQTLGRISFSTDVASLKGVPFIFEAVFEDLNVKKELFAKLDAVCDSDTIYASNTSSIAITEMAALVKNPARFVGMHFFNPVPMMKLVEVIPALQTEEGTKDLALAMAKKI